MDAPNRPQPTQKVWGETVRVSNDAYVWFARIRPGGYSSKHYHPTQINEFHVIHGHFVVKLFDKVGEQLVQVREVLIPPGTTYSVPAGVWHQFYAHSGVGVIETYIGEIENGVDIIRADVGGLDQ